MVADLSKSVIKLEASVAPEVQDLFQKAADINGCTVADFIVEAAKAEASRVVAKPAALKLSREDATALVEEILNPSPPSEALKKAAIRYNEVMSD